MLFHITLLATYLVFGYAYTCPKIGLQYSEACEEDKMRMYCPEGNRIYILDAFYGRNDTISCVKSNIDAGPIEPCYTPGTKEFLVTFCNGKQHCSTRAADNFVATHGAKSICPTPGVKKYLRVTYECRHIDNRGFACEDENAVLPIECPEGTLIRTKSAFYGRRLGENDTCPSNANITEDCFDRAAWWNFKKICDGRPYCDVEPSSKMFIDNCPTNVSSYLEIDYSCAECRNEYVWDAMCDLWAWTGECALNPTYMMDQCRRSCWGCQKEAPLCTNYAGDRDCYYWVSQGMCESNQAWMIPYCYKACTGCDARPTECINYSLDDSYCEFYADDCIANPGYMWPMCAKTCFNCSTTEDKQDDKLMCVNRQDDSDCDYWASIGECESNSVYMMRQCTKSCLGCAKDNPIPCKNNHHNNTECAEKRSYCYNKTDEATFAQMWTQCWETCSGCNPVCENVWNSSAECKSWAAEGYCQTDDDKDFMWKNCYRECSRCEPKCENLLGDDAQCMLYRNEGECKKNYAYMKFYCNKACNLCEDENVDYTCVNMHGNDTECDQWAAKGECLDNLKFMIPYCKKSCHKCNGRNETRIVGNSAIEGEMVGWTRDMTIILDIAFNESTYINYFSAFFVNNHTFQMQIWRPLNYNFGNYFDLIYNETYTPKFIKSVESFKPNKKCLKVKKGDRIGFTTLQAECPIGHNEHVYSESRKHEIFTRKAEKTRSVFQTEYAASMFAIGAGVNKTCSN